MFQASTPIVGRQQLESDMPAHYPLMAASVNMLGVMPTLSDGAQSGRATLPHLHALRAVKKAFQMETRAKTHGPSSTLHTWLPMFKLPGPQQKCLMTKIRCGQKLGARVGVAIHGVGPVIA